MKLALLCVLIIGIDLFSTTRVSGRSLHNTENEGFNFASIWGPAGYLKFQLKTAGEAVVCLSSRPTCEEPYMRVQVSLGCVNNSQTQLVVTSGGSRVVSTPDLLDSEEYVNFTIFWDKGFITLWKDSQTEAVATLRDPNPLDVNYFGFKSYVDRGYWFIYAATGPAECETNVFEVCTSTHFKQHHTTANAEYTYIPFEGEVGSLRFEVRAAQDASFVLSSSESSGHLHTQIEGVLGIDGNSKSVLLFHTRGRLEVDTPRILDEHRYLGFWLHWSLGYVSLWIDGQDEAAMTKVVPDAFEIHYLGMQTEKDDGDWKINSCRTPSSIPATVSMRIFGSTAPNYTPNDVGDDEDAKDGECLVGDIECNYAK